MREKRGVNPDWRGDEHEQRVLEGRKIVSIYHMRKACFQQKEKCISIMMK